MNQKVLNRRNFFQLLAAGSVGSVILPGNICIASGAIMNDDERPFTNVGDALKYPRTETSMPGRFPGAVVETIHANCYKEGQIIAEAAHEMVKESLLTLTGKKSINDAWLMFVTPGEKIGLKVNPVAGKLLSTSVEVVQAIVTQLKNAGIPASDIVIWDRRKPQLEETGFTPENFPGTNIMGTEHKDENDSWYDENGDLHGLKMIDKKWYYFADVEGDYKEETLPYMINQGKYSYFSKICTREVDKIINIPILKNAGSTVTLCLKNLAYGAISNTGRLHSKLWADTCAEVCAFPPLRDKVVLNIVDGIKGCYNGGPGANPQFITNYNTVLAGTDPVAVDTIGYEIILKKRIEEKIQEADLPRSRKFLEMAEELGLGFTNPDKINHEKVELA